MPETESLERSIGRLEGKIDAIISAMNELKNSFDVLERGRLSKLEVNFATLQAEVKDRAKNTAFWMSALVSIIISLISMGSVYYLRK